MFLRALKNPCFAITPLGIAFSLEQAAALRRIARDVVQNNFIPNAYVSHSLSSSCNILREKDAEMEVHVDIRHSAGFSAWGVLPQPRYLCVNLAYEP